MKTKKIISHDELQKGYTYELVAEEGKEFDTDFKPQLTPKEMMKVGIMGGAYFSKDALKEFPKEWYKDAKLSSDEKQYVELNFFEVKASQSRTQWQKKGWIYKDDPRGWIQWYFRYYLGRRLPVEDQRQIKRWKAYARHASQVVKNCKTKDFVCRPRQRQSLLHWTYDSRKI